MATLTPSPKMQFFDSNGNPLSGGKLYTFAAGTTTPLATFTDSTGGTPNTNPIILNSRGEADVWLGTSLYYMELKTSADVLVWTSDNIGGVATLSALAASGGSALIGFIQSGAGAVATTVQSKLRESVSLEDFGAVGDGVTDDGPAAVLACNYCCTTGVTLRLKPKVYKNARIEVHGTYCVEGNGATVMYLGVGQTIIAGTGTGTAAVPSSWGTDPGYSPSYAPTTMYTLASPIVVGATSFTLVSAAGISAGQYLFIGANPSSNSSVGNFIPIDFEYVMVASVASNVVTVRSPIMSAYATTQSGVFYTPGLAVNCNVSDLIINTTTDAYQYVVRSSVNCSIENIIFSGTSAVGGGHTFSTGLTLRNHHVIGAYAGYDTGRGADSVAFENISGQVNGLGGANSFYFEESFYNIRVTNFTVQGNISGGNLTLSSGVSPLRKRTINITNSTFDTSAYGSSSPCPLSSLAGVDVNFHNTSFKGAVTTPNSGNYPGITGQALVWQSGNQTYDKTTFSNCKFISSNAGNTWPSASSAFNGKILFDSACTFTTSNPVVEQIDNGFNIASGASLKFNGTPAAGVVAQALNWYEEGTWSPVLTFYVPGDVALSVGTAVGTYTRIGRLVTVQFAISNMTVTYTTASGYLKITGLPFTVKAGGADYCNGLGNFAGITAAGITDFGLRAVAGQTFLIINGAGSGVASINITTTQFPSGAGKYINGQISYEV